MKFFPKTLFGRTLLLVFLFMVFNAIIIRTILFVFVASPAANKFAYLSESIAVFAEDMLVRGNDESKQQIAERLHQRTGMIIKDSIDNNLRDTPSSIAFINRWKDTLSKNNHDLILRYQEQPEHTLWLTHTKPPLFSLSIPFNLINMLTRTAGAIFFLTFSVLMLIAYFAVRHLNRPLKELAEAANAIGKNIKSVDINPRGPEEVRAVGRALNEMKANLDRMIKAQEFLLAGISHDLRTPLTRIRLATEMIEDEGGDLSEGMKEDIQEIDVILHGIIEVARFNIESTEPWKIGSIKSILLNTKEKYQRAHVELTLLGCNNLLQVRYKPMALQRLLYNLIDNSVKHGGGAITLSTRSYDNKMDLCVSDQGPGLPMKMHKRHSFSDLTEQPLHGNGLGLVIVRRIAQLHEAELILGNNAEGGSEIILSMPAYFDRV
ncbi:MAG: ATP-binding protein [Methylococcaceae bacterium]